MFTGSGSEIIVDCKPGIYISDHRNVMAEVNIPKENISKVSRTQRKLNNLNIEEFCNIMGIKCINDSVDSVCVQLMEAECKRSLVWLSDREKQTGLMKKYLVRKESQKRGKEMD